MTSTIGPTSAWLQALDCPEPIPWAYIKHPKQRLFLIALSELGNQVRACKMASVSRQAVWMWRKLEPRFAEAYAEAWQMGGEALESDCHERATRPNFPSDALAMFLLKGALPQRYRERSSIEMSGPNGQAIQLDYSRLSDAELLQLQALALKAQRQVEAPTVDSTAEVVDTPAAGVQPGPSES